MMNKTDLHVFRRPIPIIAMIMVLVFGFFFIGFFASAADLEGKVLPGIHIGDIPIGGMTREELVDFLEEMNSRLLEQGILATASINRETKEFRLYPTVVPDENVRALIDMNMEQEIERLLSYRQSERRLIRGWSAMMTSILTPSLSLETVQVDRPQLDQQLSAHLLPYQVPVQNATVRVDSFVPPDSLSFVIVTSSIGRIFETEDAEQEIADQWSRLQFPTLVLETHEVFPTITEKDVESIVSLLPAVLSSGGLTLTYNDQETKRDRSWQITLKQIQEWIDVQKTEDGAVSFGLTRDKTIGYLEEVVLPAVAREPRDAKFEIGPDNKVTQFQSSAQGTTVLLDQTYEAINQAIHSRMGQNDSPITSVPISIALVDPKIKTGEANTIGIRDILGVGYSNFSGSPPNRIKNIRHAVVNKLDGLLVKPGETFSAIESLRPFTIEAGYLPELVIKGDRITPEIGGGLCQIGSTLFRMAMNSGMPIDERRNHSLVVRYYNDPRNGNPGTDATIYDPDPDFRFTNDTENFILIATEMDQKTGDLWFTLWGTNDGRKGYYTEPVVDKWIPVGETRMVETETLAPGVQKCQEPHSGASASFTYVRELPGKEKAETVFKSYYRPLPRICLVGVDPTKKAAADGVWTPADDIAALEGASVLVE